jgi:zinc D-Ala-D-Ala carboxypeptidase
MDEVFLDALQFLRTRLGRVMPVTSGYRCAEHPIEAAKAQPGAHAQGKAADIRCKSGTYGYELIEKSIGLFTGIGISLSPGKAQYIHLDCIRPGEGHWTRPVMWSY